MLIRGKLDCLIKKYTGSISFCADEDRPPVNNWPGKQKIRDRR